MQDSEKRLVSKAEEYNTKKPELLGYEEMKVILCVRARTHTHVLLELLGYEEMKVIVCVCAHTHTCCWSCWATRKCG